MYNYTQELINSANDFLFQFNEASENLI